MNNKTEIKRQFKPTMVNDPMTGEARQCHLVKYEKKQYETVRIGTLEYFRKIEGNHADAMDGKVDGVEFKPDKDLPVSRDDLLKISGGSLDIVARDGISFRKGGTYTDQKSRRTHNVYVYCCSMEFDAFPSQERMKYFDANEYFVIDYLDEYKKMIEVGLWDKARTKDGFRYNPNKHYIKSWDAPVRYRPRKKAEIKLPFNVLDFFVYQKDPKFIIEQEYRFSWMFFDRENDKPIEMGFDPVDIQCNKIIGVANF